MTLRPDGKPMRALRVLGEATEPLTERQIAARSAYATDYLDQLPKLRRLGLVTSRRGDTPFLKYSITDAGRAVLAADDKGETT